MTKSNVAHKEEDVKQVLWDMTYAVAKVASRGDGPEFMLNAEDVHEDKRVDVIQAWYSDLITSKSQVGIIKPQRSDFLSDDEFEDAINEWKNEKLARKNAFAAAAREPGKDYPTSTVWSRISPVRTVMNEIATEDLRKFFNGHQVRESKPKGILAFPEAKELPGWVKKWLAKYEDEIRSEAEQRIESGHTPVNTLEAPKVENVEF